MYPLFNRTPDLQGILKYVVSMDKACERALRFAVSRYKILIFVSVAGSIVAL